MKSHLRAGFTLVEMMVSLAVLGILTLIMSQLITSATFTVTHTSSTLYAYKDAATEFDLMQRDLTGIANRQDVDCILYKTPVNDCLYFYSTSPSYFDGSSYSSSEKNYISLIGYRINNQSTSNNGYAFNSLSSYGQLERLGKSLAWEQASSLSSSLPYMPFVSYYAYTGTPPTTPPASYAAIPSSTIAGAGYVSTSGGYNTVGTIGNQYTDGLDGNYSVVGSRTFRMELCYLLKDGTQSNIPIENPNYSSSLIHDNLTANGPPTASANYAAKYGVGSRWYDTNAQIGYVCISSPVNGYAVWSQLGFSDIQAIIITIATLPNSPIANPANPQKAMIAQAPSLDLYLLASKFQKATNNSGSSTGTAGNPYGSYTNIAGTLLNQWNTIISNASSESVPISGLPSSVAANIHVYQRFIYL